jgi:anti-anti-sigma regulatory factor
MSATDWQFPTPRIAPTVLTSAPFEVQRLGERLAVITAPPVLDEQAARAFGRLALSASDDGARELVLDLTGVHRHAWPAVYALCELEAHLSEACCEPVAAAAHPLLIQDLRAVGLDRAWALMPTAAVALADLLARPLS